MGEKRGAQKKGGENTAPFVIYFRQKQFSDQVAI